MVNVTSMLDVFTILLVFLLNFIDPAAGADDLELARAPQAEPARLAAQLTIGVGRVSFAGARIAELPASGPVDAPTLAAIRRALEAARTASAGAAPDVGDGALVVEVDRRVPYGRVVAVLRAAEAAGFVDFRFVVLPGSG